LSDETPTIESEEAAATVEAPARPDWLPENFKNPEALVESFKETQRSLHERSERLKELERQNEEWQDWAQQQQRPPAVDPLEQLQEIVIDPDRHAALIYELMQTVGGLQTQVQQQTQRGPDPTLTQITAHYAESQMRAQHEDWDTYRDQIAELVRDNPHLLGTEQDLGQVTSGLELAYKAVKGHVLSTTAGQAASDAAEAARLAKEQAQTMSGASSRPATQTADEQYWAAVRAAASGGYSES